MFAKRKTPKMHVWHEGSIFAKSDNTCSASGPRCLEQESVFGRVAGWLGRAITHVDGTQVRIAATHVPHKGQVPFLQKMTTCALQVGPNVWSSRRSQWAGAWLDKLGGGP